jgi:hypothetical protein
MQLKSLCLGRQLFVANAINASFVELFYLLDCHHWINLRNPKSLDHLKISVSGGISIMSSLWISEKFFIYAGNYLVVALVPLLLCYITIFKGF